MQVAKVYIQCTDSASGKVGSFIGKDRAAISPVFPSLLDLYQWTDAHGWIRDSAPTIVNVIYRKT